jgi:SagB-type dehydrogenase family enzyme
MNQQKNSEISTKVKRPQDTGSSLNLNQVPLPKPESDGGKPVMKALKQRKTIREISKKDLTFQMLSNLLWAACGVNRKEGPFGIPGRTSATASNSQEIDLYVALKEGTYLYDAYAHSLIPVTDKDLRTEAIGKGQVNFGNEAPVRLIFVADLNRLINTRGYMEPGLLDPEIQKSYYYVDTGIIASNVYLFAASYGLAAWFHNCNRSALKTMLKLNSNQQILFGQTVGYPLKKKDKRQK